MESLKFKHIAANSCKLINLLYGNQNILRYLNYLTDDPLAVRTLNRQKKVISQPDITLPLEESGILMTPFDESILVEDQCKLLINPSRGSGLNNNALATDTYRLDIIVPVGHRVLKGLDEYRDFNIAYEIAQLVDGKNCAGIGKVTIGDWDAGKINNEYCFLTLPVNVQNATGEGV